MGLNWRKIYCVVVVTDVIARLESSVEPRNNFFTVNGNVTTSRDDATTIVPRIMKTIQLQKRSENSESIENT